MRPGIAGTSLGNEIATRHAATEAVAERRRGGRSATRFALTMLLAALTVSGMLTIATPSFANLFSGIYEDSSRLDALETATGQYNAGVSLLRTVQNYAGAARWFRRAADRGHANAQAVLGSLYAVGLGVPKDFVNAYVWVSLALPRLEGRMRDRAAALHEELSALMSPAQIGEAQKIAGDWHTLTPR
jgi:TPR repeat protein